MTAHRPFRKKIVAMLLPIATHQFYYAPVCSIVMCSVLSVLSPLSKRFAFEVQFRSCVHLSSPYADQGAPALIAANRKRRFGIYVYLFILLKPEHISKDDVITSS
jgi:hypothetical protein